MKLRDLKDMDTTHLQDSLHEVVHGLMACENDGKNLLGGKKWFEFLNLPEIKLQDVHQMSYAEVHLKLRELIIKLDELDVSHTWGYDGWSTYLLGDEGH